MSRNTLLNPDIYNLNNGKAILLYPEFLIETSNTLNSKVTILNGDVNIDCLEQDQEVQAETGMNIIKVNSIESIHTNIAQDASVLIKFKHFKTSKLINRNLSFKTIDEKDIFVNKLFDNIKNDFTYNKFKTPFIESIHTPLKTLYYMILMCILILTTVFSIELSSSSRIPVVLLPAIVFVDNMGYTPIFKLMVIITLLNGLWAVKKFVTRADKLEIKRKD